jgi:hypothetical protein
LVRITSSAPGASVVVVVLVDVLVVLVDVLVVVLAAVVGGVVVVVLTSDDEVEVTSMVDDEDPVSLACLLSLLHAATVSARTTTDASRIGFTGEVWHGGRRSPDQGVGLMPTFNKL